jgi:hypothetical protein
MSATGLVSAWEPPWLPGKLAGCLRFALRGCSQTRSAAFDSKPGFRAYAKETPVLYVVWSFSITA